MNDTKLPLSAELDDRTFAFGRVIDADGSIIAEVRGQGGGQKSSDQIIERADFIVRACNTHHDLLAALTEAKDLLRAIGYDLAKRVDVQGKEVESEIPAFQGGVIRRHARNGYDLLDAAIAKAKGARLDGEAVR